MSSKDADEFKKCKTSLKVSVMKVTPEISSSLSSSRFYAVELNSIFGLSSSIQTSLTDELNRGEFKLICPKLPFFILSSLGDELKKSQLSSSSV